MTASNRSSITANMLAVFLKNKRAICSLLRRRFGNGPDIDDLSQEVFLRALRAAREKEIYNPRAFLFGVTRKLILAEMDRRAASRIDFMGDLSDLADIYSEASSDTIAAAQDEWQAFAEAVATLPPRCRKVFVLKKVYGDSNKEVASKLGISTSTVEKHIAEGLRRTAEYLDGRGRRGTAQDRAVHRVASRARKVSKAAC